MSTARQRIDESWQKFVTTLESVPENRWEDPGACGDWSIKDLMAHIAFWDDRAVVVADTVSAGKEVDQINWQEANIQEAALRASWTLEESQAEMEAAHQRLLEAVNRHPDLSPDIWEGDTFEHYDEHAADIRAWLAGDGD